MSNSEQLLILQTSYYQYFTSILSKRLVQMERQCWANVQYSQRDRLKTVGIPSSVHHNQLVASVCKTFDKPNCNIVQNNFEHSHPLKGNHVIVKCSRRKTININCQTVSVKDDLKTTIWLTFALKEMLPFKYVKVYALPTKCCGHRAKTHLLWEDFIAGMYLVVQLKYNFMKMAILFQLYKHTD